jgi:hypothetical protein
MNHGGDFRRKNLDLFVEFMLVKAYVPSGLNVFVTNGVQLASAVATLVELKIEYCTTPAGPFVPLNTKFVPPMITGLPSTGFGNTST